MKSILAIFMTGTNKQTINHVSKMCPRGHGDMHDRLDGSHRKKGEKIKIDNNVCKMFP